MFFKNMSFFKKNTFLKNSAGYCYCYCCRLALRLTTTSGRGTFPHHPDQLLSQADAYCHATDSQLTTKRRAPSWGQPVYVDWLPSATPEG